MHDCGAAQRRTLNLCMSRVCMRPCATSLGSKSKSSISQRCRNSLKPICATPREALAACINLAKPSIKPSKNKR